VYLFVNLTIKLSMFWTHKGSRPLGYLLPHPWGAQPPVKNHSYR